jgi:Tol biopolymer transport system component
MRTAESMPGTAAFVTASRDGTRLAYAMAGDKGSVVIGLRMLDQFGGRAVSGTEGGMFAVFSPDGESLAFSGVNNGKIRRIAITGGTSSPVADGTLQNGAAWNTDNVLIFSSPKGLMRVSADGGTPEQITTVDAAKGEISHVRPQYLPGDRQILFTVLLPDGPQFAVHDLSKPGHRLIAHGGVNGKYVPSGHLTFVRGSTLFAVPFDVSRLEITGGEVAVAEHVSVLGPSGTGDYSVAPTGMLAYFSSPESDGTTLAWADRTGTTKPLPGQSRKGWGTGRLSPDGHTVANAIDTAKGGRDIWTYDVDRGTLTQLTFGGQGEVNDFPIFSFDGRRVFYSGVSAGKSGLYAVATDASGRPSLLLAADSGSTPSSVSTDGKWLLFNGLNAEKRQQIMVLDLTSTATPQAKPLHDAIAGEIQAQFSRDGKWVAYTSEESGAQEMYVVPFPGPGAKVKVSLEGGQAPRWSLDGKELLYWASQPTSKLMTVDFTTTQGFRPGEPKELFRQLSTTTWDVSPDKNKFLVELSARSGATTLAIVTNWFEELRRRAPARK